MKIFENIKNILRKNYEGETGAGLMWAPFWFALGIAVYFGLLSEPNIWLTVGIAEIWLLLMIFCRHWQYRSILYAGLLCICGFLNIYAHSLYTAHKMEFLPQQMTYLSGYIYDISYNDNQRQRLLLSHVSNYDNPLKGYFRITVTNPHENFTIGQCVELVATIFPPSRIPVKNGFQLNRKYFYEKISAIGYSNSEIFPIKCAEKPYGIVSWLNGVRQKVSQTVDNALPKDEAGVAKALLIGDKSQISSQITNNYRGSGLAHFLSVSGLHMGAIAALIFFLVRFILALFPSISLRIDNKKPAALAAIVGSVAYLLISGMAIPAQRAFLMTTVVFIGVLFNRAAISMRMVSMAALIILILQPQALISISFQMSFAAVYALVAFYEKYAGKIAQLAHKGGIINKILWYLLGILIGDFVASLATTVFSIYHFHQVAIYTSLGNLLAGPLIGLWLMPNILLCLAALPFGLASYPLQLLGVGIGILNYITAKVAALPDSLLAVSSLSFGGFIAIIVGGFWLCVWRQKWRLWGIIPIMIGIVSMFFGRLPDMVIAPEGRAVAVRNNSGNMVMLTSKTDSWLKKIWQENFSLQNENVEKNNLQCNDNVCMYSKAVKFDEKGQVELNGQKLDMCAGGYYYGGKNPHFEPLWNCAENRLWTIHKKIKEK